MTNTGVPTFVLCFLPLFFTFLSFVPIASFLIPLSFLPLHTFLLTKLKLHVLVVFVVWRLSAHCFHFQGMEVNLSHSDEDSCVVLCVLW